MRKKDPRIDTTNEWLTQMLFDPDDDGPFLLFWTQVSFPNEILVGREGFVLDPEFGFRDWLEMTFEKEFVVLRNAPMVF